ncbi:DUF551 domain-containing protein [Cronobacter sakazakii]|nr:DUF551 domain-containing protein [Cronobacter sakazakii]
MLAAPPAPVVKPLELPDVSAAKYYTEDGAFKAFDYKRDLNSAMLAAPSKPVAAGWIACSERMPEEGAEVYIFCDGEWVLEAQYREGDFYDVVRDGIEVFETVSRCVSHWQPRPQRPAAPGKEG